MMFDLRRLRLLHEFSLRGTITDVAKNLTFSPSTVSQQLALLEDEAGVALFEPDGRRIRLTHNGRILAGHAARALALDEAGRESLTKAPGELEPVRIAAMPTAVQQLIPPALSLLARREPLLRVEVTEAPPEVGLFELASLRFDLVIAEQYPGHVREKFSGIDHHLLGRDPLRLVLSPTDPAQSLIELRNRAWVMEPQGTAARQWLVQQCRAAGFEPDVRFEAADLTAHLRLIAEGNAVGVLPDLIRPDASASLVELPGSPVREVFTAVRSSSHGSKSIQRVLDALQEVFPA